MRRVFAFLVVAAVTIGFFWWLMGLPGTFTASVGDTSFSAATPVVILAAIVLFLLAYLVLRLVVGLVRLPGRSRRLRAARDRSRGELAVTRTLLALAGSDGDTAMREAGRSRALLGDTPQTLLLAAYAGRQAGRAEEADAAFKLLAARKDAAFLGLRGLMQGAIAQGDWSTANALARRAGDVAPNAPWLRTERLRLAVRGKSWKEALTLAGPGDPAAALGTAAALAERDSVEARRLAKRAWDADQGFAPAALAYASRLRESGREKAAQEVLRTSWARAPHPDLAALASAGDVPGMTRPRRAELLAAANPAHGESHLLLAQAALDEANTADARRHAEAATTSPVTERRAWLILADAAERDGDAAARTEALRQASAATPDPVWRCSVCGAVYPAWQAVCDACGTTGSIVWTGVASGGASGAKLLAADTTGSILP